MTVLIAATTRDAIVMGADSQGTVTRPFIVPESLSGYFDMDDGMKLKLDSEGWPLLDRWSKVALHTVDLPYKSYTDIVKICSLEPLELGVMTAGLSAIGDRSVRSLITEFRTMDVFSRLSCAKDTLVDTGRELLAFMRERYVRVYPKKGGPELELMLCGYDRWGYSPGVVRIYVHRNRCAEPDYDFCISFGGCTREIQRLLFGVDLAGKTRLIERSRQLLRRYHDLLARDAREQGIAVGLKQPEEFGDELSLFNDWGLERLQMNCGNYSEQTAIECVDFLVNVVVKTQKFSNQIPSAGGDPQIAVVRKHSGLEFISPP